MHPAGSVILFTVASGLGFGMLTWLGLGLPDSHGWAVFLHYALAFALAGGGLLASTFHLGNPQRFLKAFSQWRSSWLSREGCLAVACLLVMGVFALGSVFYDIAWQPLGYIGATLSVLTVFATSMIYAQLKTVPRWNHWSTPVLFLACRLVAVDCLPVKLVSPSGFCVWQGLCSCSLGCLVMGVFRSGARILARQRGWVRAVSCVPSSRPTRAITIC